MSREIERQVSPVPTRNHFESIQETPAADQLIERYPGVAETVRRDRQQLLQALAQLRAPVIRAEEAATTDKCPICGALGAFTVDAIWPAYECQDCGCRGQSASELQSQVSDFARARWMTRSCEFDPADSARSSGEGESGVQTPEVMPMRPNAPAAERFPSTPSTQSPNLSSVATAGVASSLPGPEKSPLPPSLRLDSGFEQQLQNRRSDGHSNPKFKHLVERLLYELNEMRSAYQHPEHVGCKSDTHDSRYAAAITLGMWSGGDRYEVLRYSIAMLDGKGEIAARYEAAAEREYLVLYQEYNWALGDLLPEELQKSVRARRDVEKYMTGGHDTVADDWNTFMRLIGPDAKSAHPLRGISTGIGALDEALLGLRGVTVLGGDKGVGKTSLAINMFASGLVADPNLAVAFFSLDMDRTSIFTKLLSYESGLTRRELAAASPEATAVHQEASHRLQTGILKRLRVFDLDPRWVKRGMQPNDFLEPCWQLREATQASRVLIVIDLLQRIPASRKLSSDLGIFSHRLGILSELRARTVSQSAPFGYPILALSELRKTDSDVREPRSEDLRGPNQIGYVADNTLLLWSCAPKFEAGAEVVPSLLRIEKARDGVKKDIDLDFHHLRCRFVERSAAAKCAERAKPTSRRSSVASPIDPLGE